MKEHGLKSLSDRNSDHEKPEEECVEDYLTIQSELKISDDEVLQVIFSFSKL